MERGRDASAHIVSVRQRESSIYFGPGWEARVRRAGPRRLLVADAGIPRWAEVTAAAVGADAVLRLPLGESEKSWPALNRVYEWLGGERATRDTVVVALGGGVTTDLVGYAAATYLRGIAWIAIPTTLLGQVDAAIGGKVGINTAWGKNLVGAFHLPELVLVDPAFLSTLPEREWRAGLGEVIKSALISGGSLYGELGGLSMGSGWVDQWAPIVEGTARVKIDLVNGDLYEDGPRMYLNFGHTIAHALENLLGYGTITHGEAVGLGTLAALSLSEKLLGLSPSVARTVRQWMEHWGLPTVMPSVSFEALKDRMEGDKKARADGLTWVLLADVGRPQLYTGVDFSLVHQVLLELGG